MVIDDNGIIRSQFEYAPFGAQVADYGTASAAPRKGFIDKEKDSESQLSDFSARKFDEDLGKFTSVDALWEKYRSLSPYHYSMNDPLRLKDPSGDVVKPAEGSKVTQSDIDRVLDILLKTAAKPFVEFARRKDVLVEIDLTTIEAKSTGPETVWGLASHDISHLKEYLIRNEIGQPLADERGNLLIKDGFQITLTSIKLDHKNGERAENQVLAALAEELVHVKQAQGNSIEFIQRYNKEADKEYEKRPMEQEAKKVFKKVRKELKTENPEGEPKQ